MSTRSKTVRCLVCGKDTGSVLVLCDDCAKLAESKIKKGNRVKTNRKRK